MGYVRKALALVEDGCVDDALHMLHAWKHPEHELDELPYAIEVLRRFTDVKASDPIPAAFFENVSVPESLDGDHERVLGYAIACLYFRKHYDTGHRLLVRLTKEAEPSLALEAELRLCTNRHAVFDLGHDRIGEVLARVASLRGEAHWDTICGWYMLATACETLHNDAGAKEILGNLLAACQREVGEDHTKTKLVLVWTAELENNCGNRDRARCICNNVMSRERAAGHWETLLYRAAVKTIRNIDAPRGADLKFAKALCVLQREEGSAEDARQMLADMRDTPGIGVRLLHDAMRWLASLHLKDRDPTKAVRVMEECYEMCVDAWGHTDFYAIEVHYLLAELLYLAGDRARALETVNACMHECKVAGVEGDVPCYKKPEIKRWMDLAFLMWWAKNKFTRGTEQIWDMVTHTLIH